MKKCHKCGKIKPLKEYYKKNDTNDKLQFICKECSKQQTMLYYRKHFKPKTSIIRIKINYEYNENGVLIRKSCSKCRKVKSITEYNKRNKEYQNYCKECQVDVMRISRYEKRDINIKKCADCGKSKPLTEYYQARTEDGYFHICKDCCGTEKKFKGYNKFYRTKHYQTYFTRNL